MIDRRSQSHCAALRRGKQALKSSSSFGARAGRPRSRALPEDFECRRQEAQTENQSGGLRRRVVVPPLTARHIHLTKRAWRELCHQFMPITRIGQSDMGNRGAAAPGPSFDHKASRPCRDVERLRCTAPCRHGPDAMLSRTPRHLSQQPRTGRRRLEELGLCLRNGRQADKPLLETEGPAACEMPAADLEQSCRRRQVKPTGIPALGLADAALIQMKTVIQPKGLNLQFDIVDFHDRRLDMRKGDVAPGFAPTLDQSTFDQLRQRLVHSHARATILLGQLVLERDTVARRPRAGENMTFDIPEDSLVQRKRLRLVARFVGWLIARNVGTLNGLLLPASLNISQLRDSPPLTLSCFSTKASQPPHYHGNAAACVIGASACGRGRKPSQCT